MNLNEAKNIVTIAAYNHNKYISEISESAIAKVLTKPQLLKQMAGKVAAGVGTLGSVAFGVDSGINIYNATKPPPPPPPSIMQRTNQALRHGAGNITAAIKANPKTAAAAGAIAAGTAAGLGIASKMYSQKLKRQKCAQILDPDARRACLDDLN